jgi:hypothetical protein
MSQSYEIEYWQERALRAETKLEVMTQIADALKAKSKRYQQACNEVLGRID